VRQFVRVSVLIPAYNAERYVAAACQSLVNQTEACFEAIIVDDCSTDHTVQIVQQICEADDRFKLICLPRNGGPGAARNVAIAAATARWVALLDADDTFEPTRLEHLLNLAERTNADIVSDNLVFCAEDGVEPERIMYTAERLPREMLLTAAEYVVQNTQSIHGSRTSFGFMQPMLRRAFLVRTGIRYDPHSRFGEDFIFSTRCLIAGASWWVTPAALYRYVVRAGSLTENVNPDDLRAVSEMERDLLADKHRLHDAALSVALRRHKRTIDHWRYTKAFQTAMRAQNFSGAIRVAFENRDSVQAVLRDIVANAPVVSFIVRRLVAARSARMLKKSFKAPVADIKQSLRQLKPGGVI